MGKGRNGTGTYIPVIKWQRYEQYALENLSQKIRGRVAPCIEARTSAQHTNLLDKFNTVWNAKSYIDYANPDGILTSQRQREYLEFLSVAAAHSYPIIPVLNPCDSAALSNELVLKATHKFNEVAYRLRVKKRIITDENITACAIALAYTLKNNRNAILFIDFCATPSSTDDAFISNLAKKILSIKSMGFSEVYLLSGAYPDGISSLVNIGSIEIPRKDWSLWDKLSKEKGAGVIGYGDYGILSPKWSEETLKRRGGRVTLRYTTNKSWVIYRGASAKKEESITLSKLFLKTHRHIFEGEKYSYGDKLIADRADDSLPDSKKRGSHYHITEGWNHHITFVIKEQC